MEMVLGGVVIGVALTLGVNEIQIKRDSKKKRVEKQNNFIKKVEAYGNELVGDK